MGAVLLNEQERPPPVFYEMLRKLVSCVADGGRVMGAFEEEGGGSFPDQQREGRG